MGTNYFLYAEDDRDDIDIFCEAIRSGSSRVEVVAVADGYELLDYLQTIHENDTYPCLIILDLKLPRLNGMDTLQLLRTDDMYRLIPVIMFSSKATPAEIAFCKNLGAETLIKPSGLQDWKQITGLLHSYVDE